MSDPADDQTEIVEMPDDAGNTLVALRYRGRLWPAFDPASIRGVETFKPRDDDVIVVAYPKSGTHWVWEIVRLLQAGTTDVPLIEKDVGMIEDVLPAKLEEMTSPRALNTHAHWELMPTEVQAGSTRCKMVYVTRDPRDVAVSYFNHHRRLVQYYKYNGSWKDYLSLYLNGKVDYESWFAYTRGWEQAIKDHPEMQIHVTSYEALHEDTVSEIQKLAGFIGVSASPELIKQIISKSSFENMRSTKGASESFVGNTTPVMYRKGKVGDWKNWFTVAQSEEFNNLFEKEMEGSKAHQLYSHNKQDTRETDGNMNLR